MANPSYYKSILAQVQEATADALNEDAVLSGRVNFIPENAKDIEYQIKEAMGKQGIVGIIMTPECQYQGTNGKELVWDLRDFTVQIVENPIVNRSNPNPELTITALDSAIRAADVLGSPSFDLFGIYNPASIEQGEDSGLLVAQARFNCQVRQDRKDPALTYATYLDGTTKEYDIQGGLTLGSIPDAENLVSVEIGNKVTSIGSDAFDKCSNLSSVVIPSSVTIIGNGSFLGCSSLTNLVINEGMETIDTGAFWDCQVLNNITIPNSVTSIGYDAFFSCDALFNITFVGKSMATVQGMERYGSWGLNTGCVIHCSDGDITL